MADRTKGILKTPVSSAAKQHSVCTKHLAAVSKEIIFKVLLLGPAGAGKSSIVRAMAREKAADKYEPTVGPETTMMLAATFHGRPVFFHIWEMPFDDYFGSSRRRGSGGADLHMDIAFHEVHAVVIAFDASMAPPPPVAVTSAAAVVSPLAAVDACRDEVQRRIVGRMERRRARLLKRASAEQRCVCRAGRSSGGAGGASMPLAAPCASCSTSASDAAHSQRAGFPLYLVAHKADALCAALASSHDGATHAPAAAPLGITVAINAAVAAAAVDTKTGASGARGRARASIAATGVAGVASARPPSLLPSACGLEPQDLAGYAHACGYRSWHYTSVYHDGPPPPAAAATATSAATGSRGSSGAAASAPGATTSSAAPSGTASGGGALSAAAIMGLSVAPLSLLGGIAGGGAGSVPQPAPGGAASTAALPVSDPPPSILSLWTTLVDDLLEYWGYVQEHAKAVAAAPAVPLPASSPIAGDAGGRDAAAIVAGASGAPSAVSKPRPLRSRTLQALLGQLPPSSSTGISLRCADGADLAAADVATAADPDPLF